MAGMTRRSFGIGAGALVVSGLTLRRALAAGAIPPASYPIASDVVTTLHRTLRPGPTPPETVEAYEIAKYAERGYGEWTFGERLAPATRIDLMAGGYDASAAASRARLLTFFTMSDIHITDKESPNQAIYLQRLHKTVPVSASLFSGVMLYSTHVLDAAVQTINALHQATPFDFGISLGDVCNSAQYNELRWYIDVLDGKPISPSSGAHLGADSIEYQKPYQAAGLDSSIPWYQAIGNHDHFWLGSIPVDHSARPDLRQAYTAGEVFAIGDVLANPASIADRTYYMGVIDGTTPYGEIKFAGPVAEFDGPPQIAPDPDRRPLGRAEWMKEFFNTGSMPEGHGFALADAEAGFGCYSFAPNPAVPLKVIVLDDTQNEDDGSADIHGHGFLDAARWSWLRTELAEGDAAGQLMIIAAHIPIGVEPTAPNSELGWWTDPQNAVGLDELLAELHSHPNLLLWVSGHRHLNTVKPFQAPAGAPAEHGFWQVETSSLRDFPQQFRTFDIHLNADDTVSIVTTNVDPAVAEGTPAATSRRYAIATTQLLAYDFKTNNPTRDSGIEPMPTGSYNAELRKQLSPQMQQKLRSLFPAP